MRDEKLIEPFAVQEVFVDGFSDHITMNGVMRCVGYCLQPSRDGEEPDRVAIIRLRWPAGSTEEAIADAREAQSSPSKVLAVARAGRH